MFTETINGGDANDATPGDDYISVTTDVTFVPGDNSETVTITINDDDETENVEYILVTLGVADCNIGGSNHVVIAIVDDDGKNACPSAAANLFTLDLPCKAVAALL